MSENFNPLEPTLEPNKNEEKLQAYSDAILFLIKRVEKDPRYTTIHVKD